MAAPADSSTATAPTQPATPDLIDRAYAAGEITAEERLLYLAYAIYAPESLPAAYQSDTPWSGTAVVAELYAASAAMENAGEEVTGAAADEFLGLMRSDAATVCDVDDGPNSLNSANFHLNYATIGGGLTAQDYADSLELAYSVEVTDYGWAKPPYCTAGSGSCSATNPWNRYPVQAANLGGGLYGYVTSPGGSYTGFLGDNANTPAVETGALASCMVLNRDYTGFPGGPQFSLDVTTAHEFAHSIQFGYGDPSPREGRMWYESMAAYAEDEVLDDANDNYQYLWPAFDRCLGSYPDNISPYAQWSVFRYAAEQNGGANFAGGGEDLFEDFWANVAQGQGALTAYNNALSAQGTNLNDTFHAYAIATGFLRSCPDASPYCYEEAAGYRASAGVPAVHGTIGAVGGSVSEALENHYALNWIALPTGGPYAVTFSAAGPLRVSLVAETPGGLDVTPLTANGGQSTASLATYRPPADATRVLAVVTNQQVTSANPASCTATTYMLGTTSPATGSIEVTGPADATVGPGESIVHTFTLRNRGIEADEFALATASSEGWADFSEVPATFTIPDGATRTVAVTVNVPPTAQTNMLEISQLTVTNIADAGLSDSASVRTTVAEQSTASSYLPLALRRGGVPSCTPDPAGDSDNFDDAITICSGQTVTGSVDSVTDIDDVYRIRASGGNVLELALSGAGGDVDLYFYAPRATDVTSDLWIARSEREGNTETMRFYVPETTFWFVDLYAYSGSTDYTLTVRETANNGFYSCLPDGGLPGDNIDDARLVCSGQPLSGLVDGANVDDVYAVSIPARWYTTIHLAGTGGNSDMALFEPGATDIFTDTPLAVSDGLGNDEGIYGIPGSAGEYYVDVYSAAGSVVYDLWIYVTDVGFNAALSDDEQHRQGEKAERGLRSVDTASRQGR